jgi:hypothetical protein
MIIFLILKTICLLTIVTYSISILLQVLRFLKRPEQGLALLGNLIPLEMAIGAFYILSQLT